MTTIWSKAPSPCIDVCKFRNAGRCVGCAMTKPEKKAFKRRSSKPERKEFFLELRSRLEDSGRWTYWSRLYRRKCDRKGSDCLLDKPSMAPDLRN